MSGYLNADHNPALSYDVGAQLWALDMDLGEFEALGISANLDTDTIKFAAERLQHAYEGFLNAPVEQAVAQLDAMFDEVWSCPF